MKKATWLDRIDLKTQGIMFHLTGRVRGPDGSTVDKIHIGKGGKWKDVTVEYDESTDCYMLFNGANIVRVLKGVYAVEVF